MKKILKNIKGLSLSEVLVSISIVMILSVYGLSFFDTAWKYRAENDEYQTVLNNCASNLESSNYVMAADKITATSETLGSDRTVTYLMVVATETSDPNFKKILAQATVSSANGGSSQSLYTVQLITYVYPNWERL